MPADSMLDTGMSVLPRIALNRRGREMPHASR
jgi:hypothetical protein